MKKLLIFFIFIFSFFILAAQYERISIGYSFEVFQNLCPRVNFEFYWQNRSWILTHKEDFSEGILEKIDINSSAGDLKILLPNTVGIFYSDVYDSLVSRSLYIELRANILYNPRTRVHFEARVSDNYFPPYDTTLPWIDIGQSPAPILLEGRYIQIKAVLETNDPTYSPTVHSIEIIYKTINPTDIDYINFIDTSIDPDGVIVNWTWDMGDGTVYYIPNVTHRYSNNNVYEVIHSVTDNYGCVNYTSKLINVENLAPVTKISFNYSLDVRWIVTSKEDFERGYGENVSILPSGDVILNFSYLPDLIVDGSQITLGGEYYFNRVIVRNMGAIFATPQKPLIIHANTIYIDATSKIDASGCGYSGGPRKTSVGPGFNGYGPGGGNGGTQQRSSHGGGGGGGGYGDYGGRGGAGRGFPVAAAGGTSYGNPSDMSFYLGSGGGGGAYAFGAPIGSYGGAGGSGGGAIFLEAYDIFVGGVITAAGLDGEDGYSPLPIYGMGGGGGGSGGTIILRGKYIRLERTATLDVRGGDGGYPSVLSLGGGGGGGSGGRIKIFYEYLIDNGARYEYSGGYPGLSFPNPRPQAGNPGTLYRGYMTYNWIYSGYISSEVKDTYSTDTRWIKLDWNSSLPTGTKIEFYIRSSNVSFLPTDPYPAWRYAGNSPPITLNFTAGRYIQWKAVLMTTSPNTSPILHDVTVVYRPNRPSTQTDIIFISASYDPDGSIVNVTWYLGDGNIRYSHTVIHRYSTAGIYYVRLIVRDDDNAISIREIRVEVIPA